MSRDGLGQAVPAGSTAAMREDLWNKSSETILKFQRDCDRDDTRPQLSRMHLLKRQGMIFGLEDDAAGRTKVELADDGRAPAVR